MSQDTILLGLARRAKKKKSSGELTSDAERAFAEILIILEPELRKISSKLYIKGGDSGDTLQEGRLGFLKAVRDYDETQGCRMSFKNFAVMCAKRNIITALTASNRKKFDLHNNAVSLYEPVSGSDEESDQSLADFIQDETKAPIDYMILREEYAELSSRLIPHLTELEESVFHQYESDKTYAEIADALNINAKSADNCLLRIRSKSREILQDVIDDDDEVIDD